MTLNYDLMQHLSMTVPENWRRNRRKK